MHNIYSCEKHIRDLKILLVSVVTVCPDSGEFKPVRFAYKFKESPTDEDGQGA